MYTGLINKYRQYLPVSDTTPVVTLNEGNTPLIKADNLAKKIGLDAEIYLKFEGCNPTGSFKDRGMTMAVTKAKESGSGAIICASTGNTSASAAAYGAKAGVKTFVLIPDGYIALGKLSQAMMYGAEIIAIKGNFDRALELVRDIADKYPITLVNSVNPYRIEGQKTGAFEICEALGTAPDYHFIPVGNAGNITAYWKGYKEFYDSGKISKKPKMMGFEAEGAAAIVKGERILNPETIATAIRIGNPASWKKAEAARDESNGMINFVNDDEIIKAYKLIASTEGILAEPASAASVAGLIKVKSQIKEGSKIVCILTGNGLKDPDSAIKYSQDEVKKTSDDMNEILRVMNI
ncbi:MAG TPA: threonine synthase [Cyanobacteria bacterium UBA11991]|nr:threonine synthase [Cyanobacteriota bacterium]MDY6359069.1 threonine synthase [Cyanobacteriota bacterium]MDY6364158.1 threonine synthase [Cyanobacteriota bacterium]MDY6383032.1 threonine synthase [Cyanobacteriota bacterium]HCB10717.1 threonine synthase [Cyanobacteria bacterium UBA11991]